MLLKNDQNSHLLTSIIKRRFDTFKKDKDGNTIRIPTMYDTHHLTVLKDVSSFKSLLLSLQEMKIIGTRKLINMQGYLDLIRLSFPRDYIDEDIMFPILHPTKRTPVFKTWYHGDRLHIAITGELLDQNSDIKGQVDNLILKIFKFAGVIPLSRRSYLNGKHISSKSYEQNEHLINATFEERLKAFKRVVSVSEIECAFGFHSGQSIYELLHTEAMFQADRSHACYYTGKGGYFLCNGRYIKLPVKAYDCAEKNNLKKPAPKLEMTLTKHRFPDISLETLHGTAQDIIQRQECRLRKEFRKYVQVRSTALIGNRYLTELLGGIPKSYASSHSRIKSLFLTNNVLFDSGMMLLCCRDNSPGKVLNTNNVFNQAEVKFIFPVLYRALHILHKKVMFQVGKLIDTLPWISTFDGNDIFTGIPPPNGRVSVKAKL